MVEEICFYLVCNKHLGIIYYALGNQNQNRKQTESKDNPKTTTFIKCVQLGFYYEYTMYLFVCPGIATFWGNANLKCKSLAAARVVMPHGLSMDGASIAAIFINISRCIRASIFVPNQFCKLHLRLI